MTVLVVSEASFIPEEYLSILLYLNTCTVSSYLDNKDITITIVININYPLYEMHTDICISLHFSVPISYLSVRATIRSSFTTSSTQAPI